MRRLVLLLGVLLGCTAEVDPADPSQTPYTYDDELEPAPSLASARSLHAATLLADGRVLVVGGILGAPSQLGWDAFVAEAELFDPATERFEQGAALEFPRSLATATRVADGRVIVVGGSTLNENELSIPALPIEVWDPASESFSIAGELPVGGVLFHCAVALGSAVLVIDECQPGACTPLRVSPASSPTPLGGEPSYRYGIDVDCALLPDGRVLLAGGLEDIDLMPASYVEIYDPTSQSFESVGPMSGAYGNQSKLVTLDNGDVLIFGGGVEGAPLGQIYSPSTGQFTAVDGDVTNRAEHSLTLLGDGRVLILGGIAAATFELAPGLDLFDPATGGFVSLGSSFEARKGHTAVRLDGGPVLIAGGQDAGGHRADAYLFR